MGGAIFFVLTLAAVMVVGTYLFAYASHCFITVVEQTSAGNDEVEWPNEPYLDWLWEAVYVLWLTALWLGPIVLAMRAVTESRSGPEAAAHVLLASAVLIWLLFPITLLSSMSGPSRWLLLSPRLLSRLFGQRLASLGAFYLHSGPVLAAAAVMTYLTFFTTGGIWFLLLTASGTVAALLIYARQLGRLAHLMEHTRGPSTQTGARRRQRIRTTVTNPWSDANRPRQPSELPPVMSPSEGPITGYDVRYDDHPTPEMSPPRKRPIDLDDVPYELQGAPEVDPSRGPLPREWSEPSEYEMSLARGNVAPAPPAHPWMVGVYNFPLYSQTLAPFMILSGGLIVLGLMIQALISLKPS